MKINLKVAILSHQNIANPIIVFRGIQSDKDPHSKRKRAKS